MRRRHAEHRQRDVARRSVDGQRDQRARRRGKRLRRRAEQARARELAARGRRDPPARAATLRRRRSPRRRPICDSRFSSTSPSSPCHSPPVDPVGEDHNRRARRPSRRRSRPTAAWRILRPAPPARCRAPCRRRRARVSSISVIDRTRFDRASACAIAPPSSPAPIMATSLHRLRYCNGYAITSRESGAGHGRIARHRPGDRARAGRRRRAGGDHRPQRRAPLGGAAEDRSGRSGRGRDAAGRRPPLRRGEAARSRRPSARFGGLDILDQQRRRRHLHRRRVDDAGSMGRGDRDQPHRRVQRLPGGAAAPAPPRRRLHHQHQQPRRQEPVQGRGRVLRVEGGR